MEKEKIRKTIEQILQITNFSGSVSVKKEEEVFKAKITTEDARYLIGQYGETLISLEQILRQVFRKKFEQPIKFHLDINDYRKSREEQIKKVALSAAKKAKDEKRVVPLQPMNSYERRIVHSLLALDEGVETSSEGEDKERKVLVRPKNEFGI